MQPTSVMAASKRSLSFLTNGRSKLVWKAYAIALQAHMTTQDDLDSSSKAIFVASPGLFDIPAGEFAPKEITNDHIFRRTDVLQDSRSPFYVSDGDSYFDSRRRYLQSVHDDVVTQSDVSGSISKLRSEVQKSQDRSAEAYLRDLDLYHKSEALTGSGLPSFETWSQSFGVYYGWAKAEQKRLESEYTLAATKTSSSVGLALAAFNLAQETSTLRLGSNMPCSDMDIPSSRTTTKPPVPLTPDKIYYRPLYSINGVDRRVDSWVEAKDGGREQISIDLDLVGAKTAPWASLGFPNLDSDPLYNTNTAAFDVKLSLEAGGLQAFDVDRGFCRLMKITRILLGYNVKIKLAAADDMKNPLPNALLDIGGGEKNILGMPAGKLDSDDGQVVVASAPSGFPAVLAVLGREI
ncbi:hypothetical protein GCG54_00011137 [Colletotrichum gloeosporioides]|uniref:Uncharacterized protein n=1 Tax=Colletotrichum gloeosporioides TaxID=474922 RepID=A0A8H4CRS5_COLGL|nr:uncharacterized protein GCG54_00011137 [Colletotrichum gloeosporioides]KAF3808945.1 hypothetical protein GCG54_00011137 [Colletotrichum gloeosporioides]